MNVESPAERGLRPGLFNQQQQSNPSTVRPARKWERVLRALLDGPHTSRELEREPVFDHVAHTTASELRKKGLRLDVELVSIPGYAGCSARVARYSIAPQSRELAERLLAGEQYRDDRQ